MKNRLLFSLLMLLASSYAMCQISASLSVASGSTILQENGNVLTFTVTLSKSATLLPPDGLVVVYAKGAASSAVSITSSGTVSSDSWSSSTSTEVSVTGLVTPANVNYLSGGVLYAQFEVFNSTKIYKSNEVSVSIAILNNRITAPAQVIFEGPADPGTIVGSTPGGGNGTYTYEWEFSTVGQSGPYSPVGANGISYNPPPVTPTVNTTTWYRRKVVSGGVTGYSNVVSITTNIAPVGNNIITNTGAGTFPEAGDPAQLNGTVPTGGSGSYTYQWQSANLSNPNNFVNISGATGQNYDPPSIPYTKLYRRKVTSPNAADSYSNVITIQIVRPGTAMGNPFNIGNFATCGTYSNIVYSSPEWGFTNQYGGGGVDAFYTFNLTTTSKISISNCKPDGVGGGLYLLNASGNQVTGGTTLFTCDVGMELVYNTLPPAVYYIVSEAADEPYAQNMPVYMSALPIFSTSADVTIAAGTSTTLQATGSGLTYSWGPSAGLSSTSGASVVASPAVTTTYSVRGIAPSGCYDLKYITVTVTGSAGSTMSNPIAVSLPGCTYYAPSIDPTDYGNEYGTPFADVFYRFTLATAAQITVGIAWATENQHVALLNSTGGLVSEFTYIYPSADRIGRSAGTLADPISMTSSLQPGTYYVMVEGTYTNSAFQIFIRNSAACRMASSQADGEFDGLASDSAVPTESETGELPAVFLYPNPTKSDVTLSFKDEGISTVHFINTGGTVMKRVIAKERSVNLSTSDLPAGLYTLKITRGGTMYSKRLLIER